MEILTADLCDQFPDDIEVLEPGSLLSYGGRRRFGGPIATIVLLEDNVLVAEALAEPGDGKVLVIDGGASDRRALVGGRLAGLGLTNNWAGIVVNGCIRDSVEIAALDLGVLALGTCPVASKKEGEGRRNEMLRFGGVSIAPGKYLYADEDGVIVTQRNLTAG